MKPSEPRRNVRQYSVDLTRIVQVSSCWGSRVAGKCFASRRPVTNKSNNFLLRRLADGHLRQSQALRPKLPSRVFEAFCPVHVSDGAAISSQVVYT